MNHSYPTHRAAQAAVVILLAIALLLLLAVSGSIALDAPTVTATAELLPAVGYSTPRHRPPRSTSPSRLAQQPPADHGWSSRSLPGPHLLPTRRTP